jgi:thiamine biosynthesis lipoprotein
MLYANKTLKQISKILTLPVGRKYQNYKSKLKNFLILICIFGFCSLIFAFSTGCQSQHLYKNTQVLMGTFVEVISPYKEASHIVFSEIQRIENLLSKYKSESEIAKLNKEGILKASPETYYIIKESVEFYKITQGAFDITVGPLLDLWGFTQKQYRVPCEAEIKEALKKVGSDKIIFNATDNMVKFKVPGMKLDLGGIAKGFALDCAVEKLRAVNIDSCLINAGGQVYALGKKFTKPWKIAIKNPNKAGITDILELENESASTSADYEQHFIDKGRKYGHIINPKTGYPIDSDIASVTVIAHSGLTADTLSTAIFILGEKEGIKLKKIFSYFRVKIIRSQ